MANVSQTMKTPLGSHNSLANYVLAKNRDSPRGGDTKGFWDTIENMNSYLIPPAGGEPRSDLASLWAIYFGQANEVIWRRGRRFNVICLWLALWPNKLSGSG